MATQVERGAGGVGEPDRGTAAGGSSDRERQRALVDRDCARVLDGVVNEINRVGAGFREREPIEVERGGSVASGENRPVPRAADGRVGTKPDVRGLRVACADGGAGVDKRPRTAGAGTRDRIAVGGVDLAVEVDRATGVDDDLRDRRISGAKGGGVADLDRAGIHRNGAREGVGSGKHHRAGGRLREGYGPGEDRRHRATLHVVAGAGQRTASDRAPLQRHRSDRVGVGGQIERAASHRHIAAGQSTAHSIEERAGGHGRKTRGKI